MKGMIFTGCSFTWGQGLYFYSDLPNLPYSSANSYDSELLTSGHLRFKDTLRFPRLVANHFNTFEIVKNINGGSDEENIFFVGSLFDTEKTNYSYENYKHDEISYVIFQTTHPIRTIFEFEFDNVKYYHSLLSFDDVDFYRIFNEYTNFIVKNDYEKFVKWMLQENLTMEEIFEIHKKQILNRIKNFFINLENKKIKTKILCWSDDYLNLIKEDSYFNDKFIKLEYNNQTFDCIDDLFSNDISLQIQHDPDIKIKNIEDGHPSKKCHQIIADSIIKSIEKDYE